MIVVMQIWDGDKDVAVSTARILRERLPTANIGILANNCQPPNELLDYVDLIHSTKEDLHLAGGLALHELLVLGLRMNGRYLLKVEPDCTFGELSQDIEDKLYDGVSGYVHIRQERVGVKHELVGTTLNGFFCMDRGTARRIVDEKILLSSSLLNPSDAMSLTRKHFARFFGKGAHSWPLALVCNKMKIKHHDSPELREFIKHPPHDRSPIDASLKNQVQKLNSSHLRDEIISSSAEEVGLGVAVDFLGKTWGSSGVSISQKPDENALYYVGDHGSAESFSHSAETFTDIETATAVLRNGIFQHRVMNCKPIEENGISMLVLDVEKNIDDCKAIDGCKASLVSTSFGSFQIFFLMQEPISEEATGVLIENATFANKSASQLATFLNGVRIPGTASFEEVCLHGGIYSDKCVAKKVLSDDKVRLVKFVDKFFTYDEALAVIRGLAESYKVRSPVTEPEPALP